MKDMMKRVLSAVLALVMVLSLASPVFPVFAATTDDGLAAQADTGPDL